jgi:hypothetical protein
VCCPVGEDVLEEEKHAGRRVEESAMKRIFICIVGVGLAVLIAIAIAFDVAKQHLRRPSEIEELSLKLICPLGKSGNKTLDFNCYLFSHFGLIEKEI